MKKYFIILCVFFYLLTPGFVKAETISGIEIVPELDISYFAPYKIKADISGAPTSVSVDISGINGDGGSNWNYYADGTAESSITMKTMTYNVEEEKYISENIYPDDIYPEIFFAPSSITWNNVPSNIDTRRNNYHLLHFNNPFSMVSETNFFIEINAVPRSTINSDNLDVYLVKKGKDITFFNSDWKNSPDVEIVGYFDKNSVFHHTHVVDKSAHHLIPLTANLNGTVGIKSLDISDDFWIVLYSQSPNSAKAWDLRYQNSSLCTNTNRWYLVTELNLGGRPRWITTNQAGCPDVHIHIARRDLIIADGATVAITANYLEEDPVIEIGEFSFLELPNLPPNSTSFISPVTGGVYNGGFEVIKNLNISWNQATDANGDSLTYDIYLLDSEGNEILPAIVSDISDTIFTYNITDVANGIYGLKGVVCDEASLCTDFYLSSNFTIEKEDPIYSLSNITVSSNNTNSLFAKAGDIISLSFTVSDSGDISETLNVDFYSDGQTVENIVNKNQVGDVWTATYIVSDNDTDGIMDFIISAQNLDFEYSLTDDNSYVVVDSTNPSAVISSPEAGNYRSTQEVVLNSFGSTKIMYTTDDSDPSCLLGIPYSSKINISESDKIKAIACDDAGNYSSITSFSYNIRKSNSSVGFLPATHLKTLQNSPISNVISEPIFSCTAINLFRNIKITRPFTKGEDIKSLQNYLNTCGSALSPLVLDGIYGLKTRLAIIKFQIANDLVGDGIVGPITRAKLK